MIDPNLLPYLELLNTLADASGSVLTELYRNDELAVELKKDRSLVTQADRNAEQRMREIINARFPDHGILGEEFGEEKLDAEYVWTLDPIDGTISFVAGCPLFGTLIGLLHRGRPVLGCIDNPSTGLRCVGDGTTTTVNGKPVRCRENVELEKAFLATTDILYIDKFQGRAGFDRLLGQVGMFRTWGDCFGYLMLAEGTADIMLDAVMHPWDIIPLIPIVRGAGGVITGWKGEDPVTARSCLAASPSLHAKVLEVLG